MIELLVLSVFPLGLAFLLGLVAYAEGQQVRHCRDFAAAKQLSSGTRGNFAGELGGTPVTLRALVRWPRTDANGREVLVSGVKLCFDLTPALPFGYALTPGASGGRLTALLKARHEKVSRFDPLTDVQLDTAFALTATDPTLLGDRHVRLALLEALQSYPRLRIGNGVLELRNEESGALLPIELERMLRLGVALARALRDGAARGPAAQPEVRT